MSRLEELIAELCPDGVEYKKIGELAEYEQPSKYIVKSTDYNDDFETPVLTAGQTFILGYTNETKGVYPATKENSVIIFDDFTGAFKWVDFPFKVKSSAMKMIKAKRSLTSLRYVFHLMGFLNYTSNEHKRLWISVYSELLVPVPPLPVQSEIVKILDNFTELTARRKQYEYYRDKLLAFDATSDVAWRTVGEIATVTKLAGFEFTKYVTYSEEGNIIALRGLNVKNGKLNLEDVKYIDNSDLSKLTRSKLYVGDMLFTYVGTIGQVALIDENDKYYLAPNVALIRVDSSIIMPRFLQYYFQSNYFWSTQINRLLQTSSMKNIPMEKIRKFDICIPNMEVQQRITAILDRFDALCNDLTSGLPAEIEARQKQYEYYRDKLLTFKELTA